MGLDPALWIALFTVAGIWAVTVVSPGPNFLATVQAAIVHGRDKGVMVSAGIALGTTLWAAGSLLGLGLLFQTVGWLYAVIKVAGAAYLVYFGLRLLLAHRNAANPAAPCNGQGQMSGVQAFRRGLLVDLSNPKAAAFFTSLFAVALPPRAPLWFDLFTVALVVLIAGGWYALVACLVARPAIARRLARVQATLDRITGLVLVAFGLRLLFAGEAEARKS